MSLTSFIPDLAAAQKKRLDRFLSTYAVATIVFSIVFGIVAFWLQDLATGLNAIVLVAYGLGLLFARGIASQNDVENPVSLAGSLLLIASLAIVFFQPFLFITLILTPIVASVLALPFVSGDRLRMLMLASGICSVGALVLGIAALQGWQFLPSNLPILIQQGLHISSVAVTIGFLLFLVWQFHNRMFDLVQTVHQTNADLTDRNDALESSNARLEDQLARENTLVGLVTELEIPITRIADGVLLSSLIGHVDERRAGDLNEKLLTAVHKNRARYIILDISGMRQLDSQVAQLLITMVNGVTLIGCSMLISGISAQVAITLVQQGVGFDKVATFPTIEEALDTIQRKQVTPKETTIWSSQWRSNGHRVEESN
ncbi:MAG: STAS domain-containing protein [Chloroflexota bacterium]